MSGVVSSDHGFSARIVQIPGPPDLLHSGNISCPPSLQTSSETKEYNFSFSKNLQCHGCFRSSSPRRNPLVEGSPTRMEWPGSLSGSGRFGNRNRCLTQRVGGILSGSKYRGSMVLRRKEASYQLPRTSSRFFGSENIHQIKSMRTCETADGQYISSCLHKQNGRYTFKKFSEFSNRSVGMVLPKSLDSVSPASPRAFECESRQGVQGFRRLQQLEIEPRHFPDITKQVELYLV